MSTNYPGALDSFTNPTATDTLDSATVPHATQHANENDAIEAIQVTLGVNPQGGSATVVARLDSSDDVLASHTSSYTAHGATANNTASRIVLRDASGNFSAGTITATLNGNASSATTATSATTASSVPASGITGTVANSQTTATSSNTVGAIVARDSSGNFTAGTITATLNGNASTATSATSASSASSVPASGITGTTLPSGITTASGLAITESQVTNLTTDLAAKANLSGATFTGAVAVSSGNLSQTGSGQVLVQSTSTSAVPVVVKPTGSLTITGLTASHSGGVGQTYDTISGFSSTVGLVAGQSVVLSGFSNANFNGTTTITSVLTSTIQVASLNSTNGSGSGGQLVVTATQQNLQEWQYNSGTAVASVGASGIITASSFSGSGASLTSLNGGNLTDGSVTFAKLSTTAAMPSKWYSPTSNYTTGALSINTPVDPFGLTNGVTVDNSKTYLVEYILLGVVTHSASTSTGIRVTIAGDAVANVGLETFQASIATSANGNWPTANNYSAYINGTTSNWQIGGSIVTGTSIPFKIILRGILRTAATGSYFQPKLALTTVSATGSSTITINRESYASLREIGTSSAIQQGTWS